MAKKAIYFDTETTGIDYKNERIVELAGFDPAGNRTFCQFINPGRPIPKEASAIHGITDDMVKEAPSFGAVWTEFVAFCGEEAVLVAHNGEAFDRPFVIEEAKRNDVLVPDWPLIDTLKWSRKYRPDLPKHSLQYLRQVYGVKENNAHRALDDVMVLHEIFSIMIDDLSYEKVLELLGVPTALGDTMPFGKHKGTALKDLPADYVAWLKKQELLPDLKAALDKLCLTASP